MTVPGVLQLGFERLRRALMAKVVKILIALAVLSGFVVGAYAWLQSRDGADDGLKKVEIVTGSISASGFRDAN